mmetsp:Transcript_32671/g.55098  ORF Transcript_32671/g.55098 Transcript_32671/m.55098 type:complete len:164 (+) Transcript_32671:54-545(+)
MAPSESFVYPFAAGLRLQSVTSFVSRKAVLRGRKSVRARRQLHSQECIFEHTGGAYAVSEKSGEVDRAAVEKVAQLAQLRLQDSEVEQLTPQLQKILQFVRRMDELDTSNVEPMCFVGAESGGKPLENVLSDSDNVVQFDNRERLISSAPDFMDGYFRVPKVL